ncbi:MAG: glycosyltransferase family 4 protein [Anaerolineales bacterium]
MNILFLTQILPYPPDAGPRVKTWHVLQYLAGQGHQVTLLSFVRPEEEQYVGVLREICHAVYTVPIRRSRVADLYYWLRSNWTGRPFLIERDDLVAMRDQVKQIVESNDIDVIHADQLGMAQYAFPYRGQGNGAKRAPVVIFDAHNAVWKIVERMQENAPWFLQFPASLEAKRIKAYEGQVVRTFDHTLAVTDPDRQALAEAVAAYERAGVSNGVERELPITIVPIAVDTQKLQPIEREAGSKNILTLGTLHYLPNADGIRWFVQEVFPLIIESEPEANLTIIGKNPPADFLRMAEQFPQQINVTGYVPDLDPYMQKAALMVVAVRAGGGMRVRILEAFARGMPVVTTTVGLEGIDGRPGEDVLVADTPEAFSRQVLQLLENLDLQASLAENGRRLAEQKYDWHVILQKMDQVYNGFGTLEKSSEQGGGKKNG